MSTNAEQRRAQNQAARGWRLWLVFVLLALIVAAILTKLISLYTDESNFLRKQGDARSLRTELIPAHRGVISDRNGQPLAVSAPVATIWADPKMVDLQNNQLSHVARILGIDSAEMMADMRSDPDNRFMYLKRQVNPDLAQQVKALDIDGIHVDQAFKRYYPAGEVAAHLVGFTNVDGQGQEGLELAYNSYLEGKAGRTLVMRDRSGRTIKNIRSIADAKPGQDMSLSIDLRIQYLAYRELLDAVTTHNADSGSIVVLDAHSGEVLAMANQPSYNPNDRSQLESAALRNRAMTDTFEPGSTMKPISVAAALMSGQYQPDTIVDTTPGWMRVGRATVRDDANFGVLDVTGIITKSSNVGVSKLALSIAPDAIRNLMANMGLGQMTMTGFPGERAGTLPYLSENQKIQRATLAFGYGVAVTDLQLAHAYLPFANAGVQHSISLLKRDPEDDSESHRVMPENVAAEVLKMMQTVVSPTGTGRRAAVTGYQVAGKTGTAHKATRGGYSEDKYVAVFTGVVPVSDPRLVIAVMINNPKGREYFGGQVSAPVFSRVATGALRLLNVPPDKWPEKEKEQVASK